MRPVSGNEGESRVSIVTISFNQAAFLGECISSVTEQMPARPEYIVVDPGSADRSRDTIERFTHAIDRTIFEPDRGPADGLNKGFAAATGEIFGYINADDRLAPGSLGFVQQYFAVHPEVDVLCGAIRIIDRMGRKSLRARTADRFDLARYAAGICTIGQQATFFRRAAFEKAGGFNAENRISWDGELLVDMALAGARFDTTARILGDFRIYAESITGSKRHRELAHKEHSRIAEKIRARGVLLYPPLQTQLKRFLYKANIARHIGYFLAA